MGGLTIQQLCIGQSVSQTDVITGSMIESFAQASGDRNPIHVDEAYAAKTKFGARIAHGMLLGGFISCLLGNQLPGDGCIYAGQTMCFLAPVYIGDSITTSVEIIEIMAEKNRIILETTCTNQNDTKVLTGKATILPRKEVH